MSLSIIVSTAAASAEDLYVASRVRIATAVSMFTDEKSPWSSCYIVSGHAENMFNKAIKKIGPLKFVAYVPLPANFCT